MNYGGDSEKRTAVARAFRSEDFLPVHSENLASNEAGYNFFRGTQA
jgi:hypothetical protein